MLDKAHYLTDRELADVLSSLHKHLSPGGRLILRTTVPDNGQNKIWLRWLELFRIYLSGLTPHFRTKDEMINAMTSAGFEIELTERTAVGREEIWFIGRC
jgi:S-adenosylmethionine:diacylglycerol 3-amino-3-carboxypropyl transferase